MNPTDEQSIIVRASKTKCSLKVSAFAGTGKTTTFILIAKAMPETQFLYLAFNKAIATEATAKFRAAGAFNVLVKTAHALAYAAVGRDFSHRLEMRRWTVMKAIEQRFASDISSIATGRKMQYDAVQAIIETVRSFEASSDPEITEDHVPADTPVSAKRVLRVARNVWDAMADVNDDLPVTHDTYFKLWALTNPTLRWDSLFFDEAQDASPVMLGVVEKQTAMQRIFVGDTHQSIYSFRKAVDAIESIDLPMLPLTQSWRFGKNIAALANTILAIKGEPLTLRGNPAIEDTVASGLETLPDAILARTNAGLFEEALELLPLDVPFGVVGGADEVCDTVEAAYNVYAYGKSDHASFKFFSSWEALTEASESRQGASYKPFVKIVELHKHSIPALCKSVRERVVDPAQAKVILSTVHKFKGGERPHVRIANDFNPFCFFDYRIKQWVWLPEEANVQYVALTRAMKTLEVRQYADILAASIANRTKMLEQESRYESRLTVTAGGASWSSKRSAPPAAS